MNTKSRFAEEIKKQEAQQLRDSSAQRLKEKLSLIKNRRDSYRRRWFWELIQNASDYNDGVNIQLYVDKQKVIFSHDGLPFETTDVFNLIRPDSNKIDDKRGKNNIGKFGSGFVSTHILSAHIKINGIVQDKNRNNYKFEVDLNRANFNDKPTLVKDIDSSINQFATSTIPVGECEQKTSFTYYIEEPIPHIKPLTYDDIDLNYLYRTLPYALCFMPKIKEININDNRKQKSTTFTIKRSNKSNSKNIIFNVSRNGSSIEEYNMYIFKEGDASTAIKLKGDQIESFPAGISKLFCGLPLVGTERIGIPFIINSLNFEPTIERDGVEIDPSCNSKNIQILNSAIELYKKLLDFIKSKNIDNGYEIVKISSEYNGSYESKEYFKDYFIEKFKKIILDCDIAKNVNGDFINISELRIPLVESKKSIELYDFARKIAPDYMPNDYIGWQKSLAYFDELEYSYKDLASDIGWLSSLEDIDKNKRQAETWLKECVRFLKKCDKNICSNYSILPNQKGILKNERQLYADKNLPAILKRINEQTEDENNQLATILLARNFNSVVQLKEYSVVELSQRIDDNIKDIYSQNDSTVDGDLEESVSSLYSWIKESKLNESDLLKRFPWFYPKRASLIADMMTDEERNQSLKIVRSGKMECLSRLAESDLTTDDINYIINNIHQFKSFHEKDIVDDKTFADSEEGCYGESIVFADLKDKYPSSEGYKVIWSSRDFNEPCYDFEVKKGNQTIFFCDAKTTSRGIDNADSIPFFMRKSQWDFLNKLDNQIPYYVARLFLSSNIIKYINISLKS